MRYFFLLGLACLLRCFQAVAIAGAPSPEALPALDNGVTLIRHVNVIPMDDGPHLVNHSVLVRDGRIQRVAPASDLETPPGAAVIEGSGRFLIPGLCDLHVHLPPMTGDKGDASWRALTLLLANGITTARGVIGHEAHLELRERVAHGTLLGPTLHVAGPPITAQSAKSPEAAAAMVKQQADQRFDFIKCHRVISTAIYDAVAEGAEKAGIPVTGHVDNEVGLAHALTTGQQIEHLDGYFAAILTEPALAATFGQMAPVELKEKFDLTKIGPVAADIAKTRTWIGPTMALFRNVALAYEPAERWSGRSELKYITPQARAAWAKQREAMGMGGPYKDAASAQWFIGTRAAILRAVRDAGGRILACSDSPQMYLVAGFALHDELRAIVDAGLTPRQALASATCNAPKYFGELSNKGSALGIEPDFGVIRPGARADLVLLRADPSENITGAAEIDGVMIRGRFLDRGALDAMLAEVEASANAGA